MVLGRGREDPRHQPLLTAALSIDVIVANPLLSVQPACRAEQVVPANVRHRRRGDGLSSIRAPRSI
ncbi:MAG: hypothetical protein U1E76_16205 [Planctomycetota bacterium]